MQILWVYTEARPRPHRNHASKPRRDNFLVQSANDSTDYLYTRSLPIDV